MSAKRKEENKILDVNATMQGSLIFSDPVNLRINGRFEGNLKVKGNLIIGEEAQVLANIEGENIVISGYVKGDIISTEKIAITSTGSVEGNISTPLISIEEGGMLNGRCRMSGEKLTLDELSNYLDIEKEKIMQWVEKGNIPVIKENDELLFDRKEVDEWINQSVLK